MSEEDNNNKNKEEQKIDENQVDKNQLESESTTSNKTSCHGLFPLDWHEEYNNKNCLYFHLSWLFFFG